METTSQQALRAQKARALRYKKPALASMGWEFISDEIYNIRNECDEVHWFFEDDGDNLVAALDGDEDEAYEFKMAFADLESKCELLSEAIEENGYDIDEYFDDCTVALIGNRYKTLGYDGEEEDYFALTSYESELAQTESGKRVCRWTKAEMLSKIGQCMGILLAYYDLRQSYDYLKATMDILRNENVSILKVVKEIEAAYERATEDQWSSDAEYKALLAALPDRVWIE
jgi:hypothetical protein